MNRISLVSLTLAIALLLVACAVPSEAGRSAPAINAVSPSSVAAGSGALILAVEGSDFSPNSVVYWNENPRATTFINKTRLLAAILSTDVAQSGTAQITVRGTTPNSQASSPFAMTIGPTAPLTIATSSLPDATVQAPYNANVTNSGGIAPYNWRVASGQLPPGVTLNSSKGTLAGVPAEKGSYGFALQVSDSSSPTPQSASRNLNLNVTSPSASLQVSTTSLPGGQVQAAYSATLAASGGTTPYNWSLASGSLPPGLGLNASSGAITGTPSQAGGFSFTVRVSDAAGQSAQGSLAINIAAAATNAPVIGGVSPISGPVAGGTSVTITGTNFQSGAQAYFGEVAGTNIVVVSATEIRAVTPAHAAGTFSVEVSNPNSMWGNLPTAFTYLSSLQITTSSLPGGQPGSSYQAVLSASGGTSPYAWSVASGSLPVGLTLAASTGQISGTPTQAGSFSFVAHVSDVAGSSAQQSLSITIAAAGTQPLSITTTSLTQAQVNQGYSATLQATGGTSPYTWSVASGALPAGLTLSSSGQISGSPTVTGQFNFTVQVKDSSSPQQSASKSLTLSVGSAPPPSPSGLDQYGGVTAKRSPNGGTGFFRVEKFGNRWLFVTPDGNAFWMKAVYNAAAWPGGSADAERRNAKLKGWGFNTLGEYASQSGLPVGTWGDQNPYVSTKLPFVLLLTPSMNAMENPGSVKLTERVKSVIEGVPLSTYNDWRGPLIDAYDPKFATACQNEVAYWMGAITGGFADKPWIVGVTIDDADKLYGFKSGGSAPVVAYPHPGFMVATTNFAYAGYQDTKLYSKYAWIDWLKAKYGNNIAALNSAWGNGGFYTSFDSAGGYGVGTGVMDEDGRHSWMGHDAKTLSGASAGVVADLDSFLYEFAKKYAQVVIGAIRAVDRNHLTFGPAALNNYGAKARDPILRGLADGGVDVFQLNYDATYGPMAGSMADNNKSYDTTGKPAFIWYGLTAQKDSAMAAYPNQYGQPDTPSQFARGDHYLNVDLPAFWNARGANGDNYVVGLDWWELVDNGTEQTNWGLVTPRGKAYDGIEATIANGEAANYGDFLGLATRANLDIIQKIQSLP